MSDRKDLKPIKPEVLQKLAEQHVNADMEELKKRMMDAGPQRAPMPEQPGDNPNMINVGWNADFVLIQFGTNENVMQFKPEGAMNFAKMLVEAVAKVKGQPLRMRVERDE